MKFLSVCLILLSAMNSFSQTPKKAETVSIHGSNIYYEIYGNGEPLFLLHGFTASSKSWLPFVNDYTGDYEVYLIDLKGHGKSSHFTEKINLKSVATEVAGLIKYLNLDSINAIGYSYGGEVLFQLAILHPGLIKSMLIIGSCGSWFAKDFPHWVEYLSYKNIDNLPWMREQQTSEDQIRSILDQVINYNVFVTDAELKSISTRTLFVIGDKDDAVSLDCIDRARKNLPNSSLWILPDTEHGAHKDKNKNDFVRISKDFLNQRWSK